MSTALTTVRSGEQEPASGVFVRVGAVRWCWDVKPAMRAAAVELVVDGVVVARELVRASEVWDGDALNIAGGRGAMVAAQPSDEAILAAADKVSAVRAAA